jgi:hypothetical protein
VTVDAERIFEELNAANGLPIEAILAARDRRDIMVPLFLRRIEEFSPSNGEESTSRALFLAFHLLGEWRETSAYRPLAKFLRSPPDVLDRILGYACTETAYRVMAAVFADDATPLYEVVRDEEADEFIRAAMIRTIALLTLHGKLPRAETVQFLQDCCSQLQPRQDCFVWCGWVDAVAWLGLVDLKPLVRQVFARGSIDPIWISFENFEEDMRHAVEHPDAEPIGAARAFTPFGDVIDELSGRSCFQPKTQMPEEPEWTPSLSSFLMHEPERNPLRHVGRNDACPCGSGKKFKKCCLNANGESAAASIIRAS